LREELGRVPGLQVRGTDDPAQRVGVVSLSSEIYDPHTFGTLLAQEYGVEARAGLHCAPGVHEWLGTKDAGGTLRLSVGPLNTLEQIETAIAAIRALHAS
jgi:cysteine desulfurase / selenocysteine lyase